MILRMESNASYVRQALYHLATPLVPKPIFRMLSIIILLFFLRAQDLWDPALMPCPKHTAPPDLFYTFDLDPKTSGSTEWSRLLIPAGRLWLLG